MARAEPYISDPNSVEFDISPLPGNDGSPQWLATYSGQNKTAKFRIVIGPPIPMNSEKDTGMKMSSGSGAILAVPDSDSSTMLAALAKALGLSLKDLDPSLEATCVSTGVFNLMVPLRNRAALGKIQMNMGELRGLIGKHATMAYCFALNGNGKAFTRGMLPWGIYEDAATGSAAGSLGAFLVKNGKLAVGHTLNIQQGIEMGRPSQIEVEVAQSGKKLIPRVSGAAVRVFEGTI